MLEHELNRELWGLGSFGTWEKKGSLRPLEEDSGDLGGLQSCHEGGRKLEVPRPN